MAATNIFPTGFTCGAYTFRTGSATLLYGDVDITTAATGAGLVLTPSTILNGQLLNRLPSSPTLARGPDGKLTLCAAAVREFAKVARRQPQPLSRHLAAPATTETP